MKAVSHHEVLKPAHKITIIQDACTYNLQVNGIISK